MEHLIRYLSWTFVFGAIATLLYTSFKPFWNELLTGQIPPEQIQGAMVEDREATPDAKREPGPDRQVAEAAACSEDRPTGDRCPQTPR